MKRILLAGATLLAFTAAQPTLSADAPVYKGPPPVAAALFNWTGFYVGAQVGYGWSHVEIDDAPGPGTSFPTPPLWDANGFFGGVLAGYNWQAGALVLGVEGDINLSGIKGERDRLAAEGYLLDSKVDWFGSIRGRLGIASGPALFFVTGGWAWAGIEHGQTTPPIARGSARATMQGATAGAGIEWAWMPNSTVRVEYRHYWFGEVNLDMPAPYTDRRFIMNLDTITAGVTVRF